MTFAGWVGGGLAVLLAGANAVTTTRLWASPIFERPQKIAQSILVWLIPGSFAVVRHALADHLPRAGIGSDDPTVSNEGLAAEGDIAAHGGGGGGDGTVGGV